MIVHQRVQKNCGTHQCRFCRKRLIIRSDERESDGQCFLFGAGLFHEACPQVSDSSLTQRSCEFVERLVRLANIMRNAKTSPPALLLSSSTLSTEVALGATTKAARVGSDSIETLVLRIEHIELGDKRKHVANVLRCSQQLAIWVPCSQVGKATTTRAPHDLSTVADAAGWAMRACDLLLMCHHDWAFCMPILASPSMNSPLGFPSARIKATQASATEACIFDHVPLCGKIGPCNIIRGEVRNAVVNVGLAAAAFTTQIRFLLNHNSLSFSEGHLRRSHRQWSHTIGPEHDFTRLRRIHRHD